MIALGQSGIDLSTEYTKISRQTYDCDSHLRSRDSYGNWGGADDHVSLDQLVAVLAVPAVLARSA